MAEPATRQMRREIYYHRSERCSKIQCAVMKKFHSPPKLVANRSTDTEETNKEEHYQIILLKYWALSTFFESTRSAFCLAPYHMI